MCFFVKYYLAFYKHITIVYISQVLSSILYLHHKLITKYLNLKTQ